MKKSKFISSKIAVCFLVVLSVFSILAKGDIVSADTKNESQTLPKTKSVTGSKVKKTSKTGSDAYIYFFTSIPSNAKVLVSIKNENDNIVSTKTYEFTNTGVNTAKHMQYASGKGKQGNYFRPVFRLDPGSALASLSVHYEFTP